MGDHIIAKSLNWSDKVYTLSDLSEKLKLDNCLVKCSDQICSELDYFEVLCFKHIYCVRAFKVSTPADREGKDDSKNNNSSQHPLTSGDEVFIPLHYAARGTIVPLYGESHVWTTVDELIMAFPRYVLIEEDLKICSDSKIVQLKAGSELELLRSTKDKHYDNTLICRYGAQTLQLSPSNIGRFRVRPDPNHYNVKDILQRLKLPQIINFEEMVQDQWEKEVNFFEGLAPEQNYTGKFLLTGLFKDKVAVAVSLTTGGRPNSQPFLLTLSSDLLQQLTFRFAFRGDFSKIDFKDKNHKNQKKPEKKKEAKLKRGKSEAVQNGSTNPEEGQREVLSGDEDVSQSPQIPFELTYTQYRFPKAPKKGSHHGENIFKKFSSAVKTVTGKFKKASSQDVAAIQNSALSPEPAQKVSTKLYPILANLMNEDSSIYDYIESGTFGRKSGTLGKRSGTLGKKDDQSKSQFYYEIETPVTASAPAEECIGDSDLSENEDIYQDLDDVSIEEAKDGEVAEFEEWREEPVQNDISPARRAETMPELEVRVTDVYDNDISETDDGNATEKDIGSFADSEVNEYMNYRTMATLAIRRSSPGKRSSVCVSETFSPEHVKRDSNWNISASNPQGSADEKSDLSTEEERSYTESGCSSDLGAYELEVTCVVPNRTTPVPAKRKSTLYSGAADAVDSSSSERSSDAGSDTNSGASSREETIPLEGMSVVELCEHLQRCGLGRISKICQEHSLDGVFVCALPDDSLQEQPFSLSPLEVMKLSMMKKGWKPKIN